MNARCSRSVASWMSAATGPLSSVMNVTERSDSDPGSATGQPAAVTQPRPPGRAYARSSEGSLTARAIAAWRASASGAIAQPLREHEQRVGGVQPPGQQPGEEPERHERQRERQRAGQPRRAVVVDAGAARDDRGGEREHPQHRARRGPARARAACSGVPCCSRSASRQSDQQREQDRERLAHRDDPVPDPRGRRVTRLSAFAGQSVVQVAQYDGDRELRRRGTPSGRRGARSAADRARTSARSGASGQPPGGERERQVDDRHLGDPARDAADAVGHAAVVRGEGHDTPPNPPGRAGARTGRGVASCHAYSPTATGAPIMSALRSASRPGAGIPPRSAMTTARRRRVRRALRRR